MFSHLKVERTELTLPLDQYKESTKDDGPTWSDGFIMNKNYPVFFPVEQEI